MTNGLQFSQAGSGTSLLVLQGASGSVTVTVPFDLTGYSASFKIATDYGQTPDIDLSVGSGITISSTGTDKSRLLIAPTAVQTGALSDTYTGVFELTVTSGGGEVHRIASGAVSLSREI